MKVLPQPASVNQAARHFGRDVAVIHRIIKRRPEIAARAPYAGCRFGYAIVIDLQELAAELERRPRRQSASSGVGHATA